MIGGITEQLSQGISLPVADLYPANQSFNNTTAFVIGPINTNVFRRVMGSMSVGVVTSTSNIQMYFQASNANNGTFANITNGPLVGPVNTTNTQYTIEIRADQMPSGKPWVQLAILVNVANAFIQARLEAAASGYSPANQFDANTTVMPTRAVASI